MSIASAHSVAYGDQMVTTPTEAVAEVVRGMMQRGDESVKHLAEVTLIPRTTLVRRLAGTSPFTIPELERIAAALGTTVTQILTAAGEANVA